MPEMPFEKRCEGHFASIKETLCTQANSIKEIEGYLHGNGKPGLRMEVDRLNIIAKNQARWFWIVITLLAATVGERILSRTDLIPPAKVAAVDGVK